ncbi:NUDIX hydrolase [Carbonactinospora thermoautotrophica]|uniref:Mutator mutT protein (7,8-dihydro-8-oxoguanine-triphosphatase) n=1 Tax=Carbonactinospora thermoautotrophica TaxID=1469144 RepID=A0A132MYX4_9ACTN|nr:NUDIX hydrolase [Carbonactinospora thermoautotrophica]KWW97984.1 NUDIX hydrolase [Carbonactinospora thermoautotrophica]KWX03098.1 Mutator mutT protein (7,8-dihydro-8-oxoguanine-triphosphatase) [Carbonactinospora thermoautotrophica]KWX07735.1 NUDIX hydrolase [Carbonactinospora thermoautotrophica]MCX9193289.1 NUDIX hydrolase [Carbonactinospora thermoautotrophica]
MTQQIPDSLPPIAAAIVVDDGRVLMVRRRVKEGSLSWQFPAGEVEAGESAEQAAVRETQEEVGVTVKASKVLGERIHPVTGRTMIYVACEMVDGRAHVVDAEEIAEVAWIEHRQLTEYVPYSLFQPVQEYLDVTLTR